MNLLREVRDIVYSQCARDSSARSHGVDRHRKLRAFSVNQRVLKQQRFSATGRFHFPVCPLREDKIGIDWLPDAPQFTRPFELFEKASKRLERHRELTRVPVHTVAQARLSSDKVGPDVGKQRRGRSRTSQFWKGTVLVAESQSNKTDRRRDRQK